MKHSLSLLLSFGFGAALVACGDDDSNPSTPVVPDGGTAASSTAPRPSTSASSTAPRPSSSSTAPRATSTTAGSDAGPADGGTETDGATSSDGGVTVPDASVPGFVIESTSFDDGDLLPDEFTCQDKPFGDGYSPQLAWTGAPQGTLSYALVFVDTSLIETVPKYAFHYVAWNIPAAITELDEHLGKGQFPKELKSGSQQGEQYRAGPPHDVEFFGPCPSWQWNACTYTDILLLQYFIQSFVFL